MSGWRKRQIMEKKMNDEQPLKIMFAPGAFDDFEGTQEELEELQKEILSMFVGKSKEEILAMSRPLHEIDEEEIPESILKQLAAIQGETNRNLQ